MIKRVLFVALFLFLIMLTCIALLLHREFRSFESGPIADVTWKQGGTPLCVDISLRDVNGLPVPGVFVAVDNSSGGDGETTDGLGHAHICLGEQDFMGLELNNVRVVDRPWADMGVGPHLKKGLAVDVVLKDRRAIGLPDGGVESSH